MEKNKGNIAVMAPLSSAYILRLPLYLSLSQKKSMSAALNPENAAQ